MPPHRPLPPALDLLEWAGSELAAVEAGVAGALTLRLAAARVWRQGVAGFWPGWGLQLLGVQVLERIEPLVGTLSDGQWTPSGGTPQSRWAWAGDAPGLGPVHLALQLRQGGSLVLRAESWTVQTSPERPWREDWSC
jgi:hypothetical protein